MKMTFELRGTPLIAMILLASGLDFLLFGYDQGLFGGILAGKRFITMLGNPSPTLTGLVTGVYDIGCAIGAVTAFLFGERIGRKKSIIFANFIGASHSERSRCDDELTIRSDHRGRRSDRIVLVRTDDRCTHYRWLRSGLLDRRRADSAIRDPTVPQSGLVAGRSIRIDHHWSRHRFLALLRHSFREQQHAVRPFIFRPRGVVSLTVLRWRFPIACQMLFSLLVLACCPFICETPRWLAKHGRVEEARHVISRLLDKPEDDPEVKGQLNEILDGINVENEMGEPTWTEVFSNGTKTRNLQRVLLGMGPFLYNQWVDLSAKHDGAHADISLRWSGINVLCYYLAYILEHYLGFTTEMSLILASVAFTQYAIFSWPPFFYIDRIGRRCESSRCGFIRQ